MTLKRPKKRTQAIAHRLRRSGQKKTRAIPSEEDISQAKDLYEIWAMSYVHIGLRLGLASKTVERWAKVNNWVKGSQAQKLVALKNERLMRYAEMIGAGEEYQIKKALELTEAQMLMAPVVDTTSGLVTGYEAVPYDPSMMVDGKIVIANKVVEFPLIVPDRRTRIQGLKLLCSMTGTRVELMKQDPSKGSAGGGEGDRQRALFYVPVPESNVPITPEFKIMTEKPEQLAGEQK